MLYDFDSQPGRPKNEGAEKRGNHVARVKRNVGKGKERLDDIYMNSCKKCIILVY